MKLCILGVGSIECKELEKTLHELLRELGDEAKVVMSDDIDVFLKHKITKTPALLVDDKLVHNEQLHDKEFLREVLTKALEQNDNYHTPS